MRLIFIAIFSLLLTAGAHADGEPANAPAPANNAVPADKINNFHAVLLDNMKHGKSLGCEGRIKNLQSAVGDTYDVPFLTKHILRKHWGGLKPEQQNAFASALQDMIITTYATQFKAFNGEKFVTAKTEEIQGGHHIVHSQLILTTREPVKFDYVLRKTEQGWLVINVIADGVSDLALRSAQYDSIIKSKGFGGLMTQINEQNAKLKKDCDLAVTS